MSSVWLKFLIIALFSHTLHRSPLAADTRVQLDNDYSPSLYIAGGYRPKKKYLLTKHVVSIRTARPTAYFGDNHYCAGAIIASKLILTAAHCVMDTNKIVTRSRRLTVIAGAPNRLKREAKTVELIVDTVIPHPKFVRKGGNDIAILRLQKSIPDDNEAIQIIPLANKKPNVGSVCTVVGWGQMFLYGPYAANALYVNLTIVDSEECMKVYPRTLGEGMFCADDYEDSDKDVCRGDSGGPLICDGKLSGIVSLGVRCGAPGYPSVFTDVYYYVPWIQEVNGSPDRLSGVKYMIFCRAVVCIAMSILN